MLARSLKIINNMLLILNAHFLMLFVEIARGKLVFENLAYNQVDPSKKIYFMLFAAGTIAFYALNLITYLLRKIFRKYEFERSNLLPCVIVETILSSVMTLIVIYIFEAGV